MAMDPAEVELAVQRRLTTAFIRTMPVVITLIPQIRADTVAGGKRWETQTPRDPQTLRLVESSGLAGTPTPLRTADGIERVLEFMLLGEHDAQIGKYDIFSHDGVDWEVVGLFPFNGYERRAQVTRHG